MSHLFTLSPPIRDNFSNLPLFFTTTTHLKSTPEVFCRMSFHLRLFSAFSWLGWGYRFRGIIPQKWNLLRKATYRGVISTRLSTGDVNLDHVVKVPCARFLHCQVALLPFPHSVHEEGVTEPSHTQGRAIKFHLLEEAYQRISACMLKPHSN